MALACIYLEQASCRVICGRSIPCDMSFSFRVVQLQEGGLALGLGHDVSITHVRAHTFRVFQLNIGLGLGLDQRQHQGEAGDLVQHCTLTMR